MKLVLCHLQISALTFFKSKVFVTKAKIPAQPPAQAMPTQLRQVVPLPKAAFPLLRASVQTTYLGTDQGTEWLLLSDSRSPERLYYFNPYHVSMAFNSDKHFLKYHLSQDHFPPGYRLLCSSTSPLFQGSHSRHLLPLHALS